MNKDLGVFTILHLESAIYFLYNLELDEGCMTGMVIVGGGQAGYSVANKLRSKGFKGSINIICAENCLPYQRPPLSKKYLLGEVPEERLFFKPENFYKDNNITLKLGVNAISIDRQFRRVICSDDTDLYYDKLFLVTGSQPRVFSDSSDEAHSKNYYIRSIADVTRIQHEFKSGRRVLIIGGGYIGLEIASVARKKKLNVTIVESQERILKRVACAETGKFFKSLHEKNGVKIIEGHSIVRLIREEGGFVGALLDNGVKIQADFSVIGIGANPRTKLAEECGLKIDNGIWVDGLCQTSDKNILAAGDCANFPYGSNRLRLESVGNAIEQAEAAASTALGCSAQYIAEPWFWSDQYEVKLQIAGLCSGYDHVVGRIDKKSRSLWYFKNQNLIAVDAINDAKAYFVAKRLIAAGESPEESSILDLEFDLKLLLKIN